MVTLPCSHWSLIEALLPISRPLGERKIFLTIMIALSIVDVIRKSGKYCANKVPARVVHQSATNVVAMIRL